MTKNMWRDIGHSKGRFIAIILIILLGVLIFVGIKAAGPSLNDSADKTVKDAKLSDVQAYSTTGFTQKDRRLADKVAGAKAELVKFKDVVGGKDQSLWPSTDTASLPSTTNCLCVQATCQRIAAKSF